MDATTDFVCNTAVTSGHDDRALASEITLQSELPARPVTWGDVTDSLLDIVKLQNDWDGQGGIAPGAQLVARCFEFVRALRNSGNFAPPNRVRATPDGCVSFEWNGRDSSVEAEVSENEVQWYCDEIPN